MELAFAVTYHKVQGQTLDRIVLDLNGKVSVPELYVAISRVRKSDDIRILPLWDAQTKQKLSELEFSEDAVKWGRKLADRARSNHDTD